MKPYITSVFRIIHSRSLKVLPDRITDAWAFELGFLREHNVSNPELYHPVCYLLYRPYTRDTFPQSAYSLMNIDRKEIHHTRDEPMIYAPSRVRDGPKKTTSRSQNSIIISNSRHLIACFATFTKSYCEQCITVLTTCSSTPSAIYAMV